MSWRCRYALFVSVMVWGLVFLAASPFPREASPGDGDAGWAGQGYLVVAIVCFVIGFICLVALWWLEKMQRK